MTEDQLLTAILQAARLYRWLAFHPRPGMTARGTWYTPTQGDKGFPDVFLARAPRVVLLELKSDVGRLRPEQLAWQEQLERCTGIEYRIGRPADLDDILRLLA
jgi:hypothetical protein